MCPTQSWISLTSSKFHVNINSAGPHSRQMNNLTHDNQPASDHSSSQHSLDLSNSSEENDESAWSAARPIVYEDREGDTLESALDRLLKSILRNYSVPHLEALQSRLGWNCEEPITLQRAGKLAGITRERVRQIEARVKRLAGSNVPTVVYRMADQLPTLEPELWSSISRRLLNRGITNSDWSAKSVKSVLDQCGFTDWLFVEGARDSIVGPVDDEILRQLPEIVGIARRACRASGAVSLDYILKCLPVGVPMSILRDMLHCARDIEFITPDFCWVPRTPAKRVRIQNVTKKMLSINRPLKIGDIREGLRRKFSFRNKTGSAKYEGVVPPDNVLVALFRMYPSFRVFDEETVDFIGELSQEQELTRPERAIVDAFKQYRTDALDRQTIKEYGDDRGINMSSLEVEMTYSPIVVQVKQNVWRLVGSNVSQRAVSSVHDRVRSKGFQRRLIDKGRLPNGDFRIVFRLPRFVHNFVASVPAEIGGLQLDETFRTTEGVTLRCKNGAIFGFGKFLSKSDCKEGNFLIIDLNLNDRLFEWSYRIDEPPKIPKYPEIL